MLAATDILTTLRSSLWDNWFELDTWIVITASLAAMASAIPGCFLVLRRQSMMGDALTHTVLPGIVGAFLLSHSLKSAGVIPVDVDAPRQAFDTVSYALMFGGAILIGGLTAVLTEWVRRKGRVESSAALGVVYTSMFATGLLMIRVAADTVHIDPDCVLYGNIEAVWTGPGEVPRAALVSGGALLLNATLVTLFFKELRVATFDPAMATSLGINANRVHYCLMSVTAVTAVAAFESVGNILVIAMLIVPAATAHLLTDRLWLMILFACLAGVLSSVIGHAAALVVPPLVMSPFADSDLLSGVDVASLDASTSGMMALASGFLFTAALFFGPRHGLLVKWIHQLQLSYRVAAEDILGALYRQSEQQKREAGETEPSLSARPSRFVAWRLRRQGLLAGPTSQPHLTAAGEIAARRLVRAHRLWESYMAKHFDVPGDHLHEAAHRVEHFLDPELRSRLADELDGPARDPHGKEIPSDA